MNEPALRFFPPSHPPAISPPYANQNHRPRCKFHVIDAGTTTATYTTDADGHITGDGTNTWTYGTNGRLKSATVGGVTTSYGINFLGQRITKSGTGVPNGGTNEYLYDEAGHLIGEYNSTGAVVNETIYLPHTPVAMLAENSFFGEGGIATPVAVTTSSATYSVSAGWENEPHIIITRVTRQEEHTHQYQFIPLTIRLNR